MLFIPAVTCIIHLFPANRIAVRAVRKFLIDLDCIGGRVGDQIAIMRVSTAAKAILSRSHYEVQG